MTDVVLGERKMRVRKYTSLVGLVLIILAFNFCAKKITNLPEIPKIDVQPIIEKGDGYFKKMHLYAWEQAYQCYNEAYQHNQSDGIKEKLFRCLAWIWIRQKEENLPNKKILEKIENLKFIPIDQGDKLLNQTIMVEEISYPMLEPFPLNPSMIYIYMLLRSQGLILKAVNEVEMISEARSFAQEIQEPFS